MNILIDLFDHSGHSGAPYKANGWHVIQIDIKHGIDILTWDYKDEITKAVQNNWHYSTVPKIGLLAAIPCTDYATSGARHFAVKDAKGITKESDKLVDKVYEIKVFIEHYFSLAFWRVENPRSRIHTLHPWLGKITHKFNPCDYAKYTNPTEADLKALEALKTQDMSKVPKEEIARVFRTNAYNKETWLWGNFNKPVANRIEPPWKDSPIWRLYGGKSEAVKEKRSVDPQGFCQAFYEANH